MTSWLVPVSTPTGNNRRIELAGLDLSIIPRIDNIFVYPGELNIDRFKSALSQTLSLWPLVAGRFLVLDDGHYFIEMSDNGIPVTYTENTQLEKWPLNNNVVVDITQVALIPYIDGVQTMKLMESSNEEPLLRLKLTCITQSGEWVLATSWAHVLGDAESNLNFLTTISRLYQQLEPMKPLPTFERRLWREDEADQSLLPLMKELINAKPLREMIQLFLSREDTYEQLNLHFSSKQLSRLHELAGGKSVTTQDALTSYIILLLNTNCFKNDDEHLILRTNTAINFRGVCDFIAPIGLVSNAVIFMASDIFDDPLSLSSIAKTIRRSIVRTREPKFLEPCVATADRLLRKIVRENFMPNLGPFPNDVTVNSNFRFDWAFLVDFGYTDKCRFYTPWTGRLYFRVFHLNPIKNGNEWLPRDRDGAEVAFRIAPDIKEKFISAWEKDVEENFSNIKL
ncbi:unnamed protein product [Rotaria sp. Silwood1]|nr:unnamed protein product [Rotaria sp. Silwood1]CAF3676183.1 unnamed protein product [Rotaria sp. Silwood1]CAF3705005.1 unnamed protein product [Rotaria sp. Silwood1]CAF3742406.1 unnamed protein product [Rotaria sp. Silwood1]CAF4570045.1 unnamed protein product [Rotaria sp. Silwood1]